MMTAALLLAAFVMSPAQETGSPGQNTPREPAKIPVDKPKEEPKPVGTKTFADKGLNLAFDYPANWTYQKADKSRPARFTIPIEGTTAKGELQIIDLEYRATPEAFQETQKTMIDRLNQQLLRQWEIEVLGVPLLMTELKNVGEDGERTTRVGLLYTSTPRKFNFRLSAPSANFEAVGYQWQGVLETLRTTSGALPTAEGTEAPKTAPTPPKEVRTEIGPKLKNVTFRGPVTAPLAFGGTSGTIYLPKGWTTEPGGEGTLTLRHPKLSAPLTIRGYLGQADNPTAVLTRSAAETIAKYAKVERRYDQTIETSRTGASAVSVIRVGSDTEGKPRMNVDAVVSFESLFVLIRGESATATKTKEEMKLVTELLDSLRLEPTAPATTAPVLPPAEVPPTGTGGGAPGGL